MEARGRYGLIVEGRVWSDCGRKARFSTWITIVARLKSNISTRHRACKFPGNISFSNCQEIIAIGLLLTLVSRSWLILGGTYEVTRVVPLDHLSPSDSDSKGVGICLLSLKYSLGFRQLSMLQRSRNKKLLFTINMKDIRIHPASFITTIHACIFPIS